MAKDYLKLNKNTHLYAKHLSNHPQSLLCIFILLIKMKPRDYIGENIPFMVMNNIKQQKLKENGKRIGLKIKWDHK